MLGRYAHSFAAQCKVVRARASIRFQPGDDELAGCCKTRDIDNAIIHQITLMALNDGGVLEDIVGVGSRFYAKPEQAL